MIFKVRKASDLCDHRKEEVSTLKELEALQERYGCALLVDFYDSSIIVYDDYVE